MPTPLVACLTVSLNPVPNSLLAGHGNFRTHGSVAEKEQDIGVEPRSLSMICIDWAADTQYLYRRHACLSLELNTYGNRQLPVILWIIPPPSPVKATPLSKLQRA